MISTALRVAGFSFKAAPAGSSLISVLALLLACVPAAQVLAMAALLQQLSADEVDAAGVAMTVAWVVLLVGLIGPVRAIRDLISESVMLDTGALLQGHLADKAASLTPAEIAEEDLSAEIEGHSRAIVDRVSRTYIDALLAAEAILGAVGVVITLGRYSPLAGLLVAISIAPTLITGVYISRAVKSMWLKLGQVYRRERYLRETLSSRTALLELTAFGTMSHIAELEKNAQAEICAVRKAPIKTGLRSSLFSAATNAVLFVLAIFAVFSEVGLDALAIAAIYGVFGAVNAVAQAATQMSTLIQYSPTVQALFRFFVRPEQESLKPAGWGEGDIRSVELRDIHVSYGEGDFALKGAGLRVSRGEMVALVGKNGAGKTTLLNALLGLVPIRGGHVIADGFQVEPAAQDWWLDEFGVMAQSYGKYEVTIEEAVLLGGGNAARPESVDSALKAARALDFVENLPKGKQTRLGETWGGVGLSGGQWQRLALARVYLRDANVWILDEPSSAIDAETEVEIFDGLHRSKESRATIVVSHRAWTLRRMDRIYFMDEGVILEEGTFESLIDRGGSFARLFREQTSSSE